MTNVCSRLHVALVSAALALSCSVGTAEAQKATDLVCKGCVHSRDIADGAVVQRKIKNNAVARNKIKDKAINAAKLSAKAKPAGASAASYPVTTPLSTSDKVYADLQLEAPATGYVFVNVTGNLDFAQETTVKCYFDDGLGSTIEIHGSSTDDSDGIYPFSHTHLVELLNPGPNVIEWRCALSGASDTAFNGYEISGLYVPVLY